MSMPMQPDDTGRGTGDAAPQQEQQHVEGTQPQSSPDRPDGASATTSSSPIDYSQLDYSQLDPSKLDLTRFDFADNEHLSAWRTSQEQKHQAEVAALRDALATQSATARERQQAQQRLYDEQMRTLQNLVPEEQRSVLEAQMLQQRLQEQEAALREYENQAAKQQLVQQFSTQYGVSSSELERANSPEEMYQLAMKSREAQLQKMQEQLDKLSKQVESQSAASQVQPNLGGSHTAPTSDLQAQYNGAMRAGDVRKADSIASQATASGISLDYTAWRW